MREELFRKGLVCGIMLVFVTISIIPSVASNNYSAASPINLISAKDTQTNLNNDDNYEIIWGGNASIDFLKRSSVELTLNCDPDCEKNICIPGPDLYLIFILGASSRLRYIPIIFPRIAGYQLVADIDDTFRGDGAIIKLEEPGTKSNILGVGYLLENVHDKTVKITLTATIYSIFPFRMKECKRNVILNIIVSPPNPPSGATNGKAGVGSGEEATIGHTWFEQGTYNIMAKARDIYCAESDWGTLTATMPRNQAYINTPFLNFLQNFLQNHPNLFPILQHLLKP